MIGAVAAWDEGNLPDNDILESPPAFRRWFEQWMERQKERRPGEPQAETNGFVIHE